MVLSQSTSSSTTSTPTGAMAATTSDTVTALAFRPRRAGIQSISHVIGDADAKFKIGVACRSQAPGRTMISPVLHEQLLPWNPRADAEARPVGQAQARG